MSLQVWLPLNGDLHNQGLDNTINVTNTGAVINNIGKIGQCYEFAASKKLSTPINIEKLNSNSISFACWIYVNSWGSSYDVIMSIASGTSWNSSRAVLCRNNTASTLTWNIGNNSTSKRVNSNTSIALNTWVHIAATYDGQNLKIYLNGILDNTITANLEIIYSNTLVIGAWTTNNNYPFNGKINDVRIYNHCLSSKEVEEISKGLILHLPLNNKSFYMSSIGQNLFKGSGFTQADYDNMTASSSSTDWTKYIRWYNGSKAIHTFTDGIDTILLNTTGNLGICFVKKATDIGLDSNSYYTISCEAKCTKSGAQLGIGLSYYTTGNAWTWRGGTNKVTFDAVNTWQTFTLTFKPDSNTQYICYCFTCADGVSGGTDTFSIRYCKLEKGSTATQWIANPEEESYGLLDTVKLSTCYDCSGYNHNGTAIGDFNIITNSPVYADYINLETTTSHIYIPNLNVTGFTDSYSIAWWGNVSNYSGRMMWGFGDGCRLNGIYNGVLWNTGDGANNPLYSPGTTTQVSAPTTNTWHHFVMVGNGTKCLVYKDGILWAEAKTYKSLTGTIIYMNGWLNTSSYTLANTKLVDFRIYATALNADDIKELYRNSMIISGTSVVPRDLE